MERRKPKAGVSIFSTLEVPPRQRARRWVSFGAGVGIHLLALGLVLAAGIIVPYEMQPFVRKAPVYIELIKPPHPQEIRRSRQFRPAPRLEVTRLRPEQIVVPVIRETQPANRPEPPELIAQVPPEVAPLSPAPLAGAIPKAPPIPVKTDVFSGSSAAPRLKLPPSKVQTGGFGSPTGLPGEAQGESFGNVARLGSFDLPLGEGYGNGTGGTKGARGTIASAGFGNGISTSGEGNGGSGSNGRGSVRAGSFDVKPIAQAPVPKRLSPHPASDQPVEILSKPNPAFTDEARKLGLQGEVVLAVVFMASGKLRVLRVVRGLGHGLDESACRAAEQIRFKPAQRDGQPMDFPATLRVVFQLAG
ncbi:MAG: TonB family protein [Acidobacteria bacterium]|nr:TonB family protein [Acidobacteriota bacterium]